MDIIRYPRGSYNVKILGKPWDSTLADESDEKKERVPKHALPDAWDLEAKRLIKGAMTIHNYTPKSLAAMLVKHGYEDTESSLALRIKRASFSFGFALRVLRTMGVKSVEISHIPMHKPPPKKK